MAISPNDFSLWARLTGNKYPSTPAERAKKGPEVHNFIQNLDKEGMLGEKEPEQPKKEKNLAEKIATGALIAGGVAATVAAGRDPRVQNVAKRAASATKTKIDDFLSNLGKARVVDVDIVDASGDVTPDPRQQQSNVAPQLTGTSAVGRLTSIGDNQVRDPELGLVTFDRGATPEQINNILTSIKMDRALDRKAKEGTLTRKDERQFLKKELTRSGTTPQELFGTDTIDSYLDQMATQGAFGADELIRTVRKESPTREIRPQGPMPPEISIESVAADASVNPFAEDQEEIVREHAQLKGLGYGDQPGYIDRDPVSGYRYEDIKNKLQDIAVARDRFTPAVQGKTFGTSGAVSKPEDIGDAKLRAKRTYGPMIDAIQQKNPGINVGSMGRTMLAKAEQDRDYDIAYMVARGQGKTDETATQIARATAGFPTDSPVGKPTPYREFLGEQRTGSIRKESIDNLLKLVQTGPQINLPESVQEPGALVQLAAGSTPSNKVPTMGATIGGSSLTDKHATKMAVDNVLDEVKAKLTGTPVSITGVRIEGPSNVQKSGPGVVVDKEGNVVGDANYRSGQRELPIVYSTERETNQQMRRIEPTAKQSIAIKQEQGEVATDRFGNMMITSPTYDSITGFKSPSTESISTNPLEERISRLEGKTAELRAIQENLSRAGELMSAGFDPRTTRFDSARAAGLTSKTGIEPRITNPRFQENMNLGKVQEAALPKPSARAYFEQDSEGRIIPATMEQRSADRRVVKGPDTRTIKSGGGYQPRGGVGSSIGAYGVEPSDFAQADVTKKPTEISLPKTARDKRGMSNLSNRAVMKLAESSSRGTREKAIEEMGSRNPSAKLLAGGKAIMGSGAISDPTKADASASFDAAREMRKIQTTGNPATANERVAKFLDNLKKQQGG